MLDHNNAGPEVTTVPISLISLNWFMQDHWFIPPHWLIPSQWSILAQRSILPQ